MIAARARMQATDFTQAVNAPAIPGDARRAVARLGRRRRSPFDEPLA